MSKVDFPSTGKKKEESCEFQGKQFKVERPQSLSAGDIQPGDRVIITTGSGNRYMLRQSKSAGGIKLYNEKADGFKVGYPLHDSGQIAKVGEELAATIITAPGKGRKVQSTVVTGIEIRRGIDAAIEENANQSTAGFGQALSSTLKEKFHGKSKPGNDDDDAESLMRKLKN